MRRLICLFACFVLAAATSSRAQDSTGQTSAPATHPAQIKPPATKATSSGTPPPQTQTPAAKVPASVAHPVQAQASTVQALAPAPGAHPAQAKAPSTQTPAPIAHPAQTPTPAVQTPAAASHYAPAQAPTPQPQGTEARAARAYQTAVHGGPLALHAFLVEFPKGADLHVHLSGAVYAESFIRAAGEDGLCVDTAALSFAKPPCVAPLVPAAQVPANQDLYDRLINAFSMRSFVPTPSFSGHDQFFSTFGRFGGLNKSHTAEWVNEAASRAAAQNEQYLELMETPPFSHAAQIARQIGWGMGTKGKDLAVPDFVQFRQALLDHGLRDEVAADRDDVRLAEVQRRQLENCDTQQAMPACQVEIRFIYQVLRGAQPEQVFAQTLLGFETIQATLDARETGFAAINFVQPEDGFLSMRDYSLHMRMLGYLHSVYPKVHISLHAGELAPGLVPPEGLRSHIREAVERGHAERIGHGVDVMYEDNAADLLKELAQKHIMIEVNLSSNEGILGIKGIDHPFSIYRAAHVPVALSTDDEGVSRIDITHEYVRAALDYHLSYQDLKQLARTGLEHNFLPGDSLWAAPDTFAAPVAACKALTLGQQIPTTACKTFLSGSEKATAQWELEHRFHAFEARF
jgi:adenosine deaminase